jgi:4-amino-4-deoxy-L-arabinose transferase-like glycosyltransferase
VRVRPPILFIALLTLVALGVRLSAMRQSLYGDEIFAFHETAQGVAGIFDALGSKGEEVSPPLFFLFAEKTRQLGDPTVWIRLPSLLFGTATVPVVYLLGRRVYDERTGLIAAVLVALSPFAIFYSTEARPYATLACLIALSTFSLVNALESGRLGWWLLYVIAAAGAMYTHYTGVFVLAAQTVWACWAHRERLRGIAVANAAVFLAFLPWVPVLDDQLGKDANIATLAGAVDSAGDYPDFVLRLLTGHPFVGLDSVPGTVGLAALALAGCLVLVAAGLRAARRNSTTAKPERITWLLPALALATPLGLALYGAFGSELYNPRNLIASMPAVGVVVARAIARLGSVQAAVATTLVITGLGIAAGQSLSERFRRPPVREIAHYIDKHAREGDFVVAPGIEELPFPGLSIYFKRDHRVATTSAETSRAWSEVARGRSLFQVSGRLAYSVGVEPLAGPGRRYPLREGKLFPGLVDFGVGRYSGELEGELVESPDGKSIRWSLGKVRVVPDAAKGALDGIDFSGSKVRIVGWAVDTQTGQRTSQVLLFEDGRLVAVGTPALRPDVAASFGRQALPAGFTIEASSRSGGASKRVRVFAVVDDRATELHPTESARRRRDQAP